MICTRCHKNKPESAFYFPAYPCCLECDKTESQKRKIRGMHKYLVKSGKLKKRPCFYCDSKDSEMHHIIYKSCPTIIWVCRKHHISLFHPKM